MSISVSLSCRKDDVKENKQSDMHSRAHTCCTCEQPYLNLCAPHVHVTLRRASFVMRSPVQFNRQFHLFWPGRRMRQTGSVASVRRGAPEFFRLTSDFRRHTKLFSGWMESGKSRRGRPFKLRRGHAILSAVVRKSCGRPWWK